MKNLGSMGHKSPDRISSWNPDFAASRPQWGQDCEADPERSLSPGPFVRRLRCFTRARPRSAAAASPRVDGSGITVILPAIPVWPVTEHVYQKVPAVGVHVIRSAVGAGSAVKSAIG
jgi:hypothetical protein